ncbi:hypothetical protein CBR_g45330 [Chara braunii]|uniref:histidine--tRNA ligase n=1 Tax=Chara braunii TaxID=69332 RepID=A0A388LY65_CHABU|nr:hypothetical protein CBR_g45330 [Chara braunii]|eukprot:GBG87270.1 hypothetical protein CBR_g45330 [Chara braunii]
MRFCGLVVCGRSNAHPFVLEARRLVLSTCLCGLRRCLHRGQSNAVGLITLKPNTRVGRLAGTSRVQWRRGCEAHRVLRVEDVSSGALALCTFSGSAADRHQHQFSSITSSAGHSLRSAGREIAGAAACNEESESDLQQQWSGGRLSNVATSAAEEEKKSSRSPGSAGPRPLSSTQLVKMIDVNPPRGTRDFFPEDLRLRSWLFDHFREVSRCFGFEEVDAPVLESEELFVRKAGEEITEQLYNFEDKGNRRVALRPELTPSLARLILQKGKGLSLPIKWSIIGQCWRYERMTRGRRREHYQWNMDIVGVPGVEAEAELLSAITLLFTRLGITQKDVGIRLSSREVLQCVLEMYRVPQEAFVQVCVIVDKIGKLPQEEIEKELSAIGIPTNAIKGILSAMELRSIAELEQLLGPDDRAVKNLKMLFELAEGYGYREWLQFDASVVRGLAYYTGIVFEGFDKEGKLRAICGGGRYDCLLSSLGGEDTPACGFGFGDAVIVELLKEKGLLPTLPHRVDDVVVAMVEDNADVRVRALSIATKLRRGGRSVDLILENRKMKWVFKHAERLNAKRMCIIGTSEFEREVVRVKNLETREEADVPWQDVEYLEDEAGATALQRSAEEVDQHVQAYIVKLDEQINKTLTPVVIEKLVSSGGGDGGDGGDGSGDGDGDRKKKGVLQEDAGEVRKIKPAGEGDKEEAMAEEEEAAVVEEEDPTPRGVVAKEATTWEEGAMVPRKVVEDPTPHGEEEEACETEIGIDRIHPIQACPKADLGKS